MNNNEKGSTLLIVLITIVLLVVVVGQFSQSTFFFHALGTANGVALQGTSKEDSLTPLIKKYLNENKKRNAPDHYYEQWRIDLRDAVQNLYEGEEVTVTIEDLDGLFPINIFAQKENTEQYEKVFLRLIEIVAEEQGVEEEVYPKLFVQSLKHWMGNGDTTGREKRLYAEQEPSYTPPKSKLLLPGRLALVHWPKINEKIRRQLLYGEQGKRGLIYMISTHNITKININTASQNVLEALCTQKTEGQSLSNTILEHRSDPDNTLTLKSHLSNFTDNEIGSCAKGIFSDASTHYKVTTKTQDRQCVAHVL